jgi:hypothetical protein
MIGALPTQSGEADLTRDPQAIEASAKQALREACAILCEESTMEPRMVHWEALSAAERVMRQTLMRKTLQRSGD